MKSGKNSIFRFKEFSVNQTGIGMKVCTDSCVFGALVEPENAKEILDIGTGTGLLSLMIAQKSDANLTAVELDETACKVSFENFKASPWGNRISLFNQNFQDFSLEVNSYFDLIVSNPPFYSKSLLSGNSKRDLALHSLELPFTDLADGVARLLKDDGKFWVMLPEFESGILEKLLAEKNLYPVKKIFIHHSSNTHVLRVVSVYIKEQKETSKESFFIKNQSGLYTSEFSFLLKPYYLIF